MSEYQRYDFLALDRVLSPAELAELRAVSTRAEITATSFSNEYHFGNFKAEPAELLARYFDVFVYSASWGTRELMLRVGAEVFDDNDVDQYLAGEHARAWRSGEHWIVSLSSRSEEYERREHPGGYWLSSLAGVREALVAGDRRVLYLAWLVAVVHWDVDDEWEEPRVPAGLGELTAPLSAMAEFLRVDPFLVKAAAEASAARAEVDEGAMAAWLAELGTEAKDELLLRVVRGEGAGVRAVLQRGFADETVEDGPERRRVSDLKARAVALRRAHEQSEKLRAAEARMAAEAARARERAAWLAKLGTRVEATWTTIEGLVGEMKAKSYDEAVGLLVDLRDVAQEQGGAGPFEARLRRLLAVHSSKSSFQRKAKEAGL